MTMVDGGPPPMPPPPGGSFPVLKGASSARAVSSTFSSPSGSDGGIADAGRGLDDGVDAQPTASEPRRAVTQATDTVVRMDMPIDAPKFVPAPHEIARG